MPDKKQIIEVKGTAVTIIQVNQSDYISLTNIARHKNPNEPKDINALLIRKGIAQSERLLQLNEVAIQQMKSLLNHTAIKKLQR